ncbi:hypothetical protein QO206_05630 [Leeuwenhoekiella aequorea]|uniref:hypothetical protein n=1 Tax=Leeuwenhoekiella aequorea TaxID=283736 RepID=UPI00352E375D|tara:strand:- start:42397 stop:43113 length:717 start_codon:yes stop_codon:yes gene_type:complete
MDIQTWKKEVLEYNNSLNEELKINSEAKELYYGFDVIDGKLLEKAEVLFIGINPGKGSGEVHHTVVMEGEYPSYLEVFFDNYKEIYKRPYLLAEFAVNIFMDLGFSNDEINTYFTEKCIKTNFYHIITNSQDDIETVLKAVGKEKEYNNKSCEFTEGLIKATKPKLVIFEGKAAYNWFVETCCEEYGTWDSQTNIAYYFVEDLNVHCIGFKRNGIGGIEADVKDVIAIIQSKSILKNN